MNDQLKTSHNDIISEYISNAKEQKISHYIITVARDGESPVRSIISYDNVVDAVAGYEMYKDAGFAKNYLTVSLYEPSGKINTKVLKRNQAGDPSFVRQNYIDITNALLQIKDKLSEEDFETLCIRIGTSFGRDNWRFNIERFFNNLGIKAKAQDYIPVI
jgi:hypothetical protein